MFRYFLAICLLSVASVLGQSDPGQGFQSEIPVLDEVIITGFRHETLAFEAPAAVEQFSRERLEQRLVRTVPEALRTVPGVAVQKTANGQGSPIIRGFTGYRTLGMVDGIRYNHSAYRDGPNEYFALLDAQALDQLELVQGPASVLYGSDAVGGALNLFTQAADYLGQPAGQFFQTGHIFSRWHSSEQSLTGRAVYDIGVGDEWGLHLGGTWKEFGDVISAELGEQPFTGYSQHSYDARFDTRLDELWTLTLAHQALWQDDAWRTHTTVFGRSFAGSEVGSDFRRVTDYRRSLSYARLSGDDLAGFIRSAQFTISWQTLAEGLDRIRSSRVRELSNMDIHTLGLDIRLTSEVFGGTLTWGTDYYRDRVDTGRSDLNPDGSIKEIRVQGPVGDDSRYQLLGIYAEQELPLGTQGTKLFLGGRYTLAQADVGRYEDPITAAAASLSEQWHNVVGSLRITQGLGPEDSWLLYGAASQAFRAPNLGDLSRLGASRSDEIESAAVGLKPERFTNFEIGLKHRSDQVRISASAFHTLLDDYITSTPTGRVIEGQRQVSKQNSAQGFVQGAHGEIEWDIAKHWTLFGGTSWTEGEADAFTINGARREPLSRIPPLMAFYGLRWTSTSGRVWAEFSGTTADEASRLSSADQEDRQRIPPDGTPGYTLLNLRLGWQVNDQVTLLGGLDNILDQAYRVHGSGTNEPGFGCTLGVKITL